MKQAGGESFSGRYFLAMEALEMGETSVIEGAIARFEDIFIETDDHRSQINLALMSAGQTFNGHYKLPVMKAITGALLREAINSR
ncbi:hypothetical protein [Brucella cytisi]|uniref:Uncharacterized protein n=1 Tax=Brucella cytisi TaxID=407152 RepID=A0A1J6HMG6_9HYPH|nr:hypothetical protein [Brucella cytisi]OIS93579.1 hypothetical protein BLA27_09675 [Brucella cytisi]